MFTCHSIVAEGNRCSHMKHRELLAGCRKACGKQQSYTCVFIGEVGDYPKVQRVSRGGSSRIVARGAHQNFRTNYSRLAKYCLRSYIFRRYSRFAVVMQSPTVIGNVHIRQKDMCTPATNVGVRVFQCVPSALYPA